VWFAADRLNDLCRCYWSLVGLFGGCISVPAKVVDVCHWFAGVFCFSDCGVYSRFGLKLLKLLGLSVRQVTSEYNHYCENTG
jgi:hypothetical protein